MGNNNSINENHHSGTMVFEIFRTLKWIERIWKVFCFRFEYKYYKIDTNKYMIEWEEFERIFLDEFYVDNYLEKLDLNQWIIYNVFKKIFEYDNNKIRVYRVYLMFFPYCLHINGAEGMNFIDFLFEKIIYNLETEMSIQLVNVQPVEKEESDEEDVDDDYFGIYNKKLVKDNKDNDSQKSVNDISEDNLNEDYLSRPDLSKKNLNTSYKKEAQNIEFDYSKFNCKDMEKNLIRIFYDEFLNTTQLGYIRIISYELFKQIMYVYFYNNIVLFLRAFKDIITDIDLDSYEDEVFVEEIKVIQKNNKNIRLDLMTEEKINHFLDNSFNELFLIRNNLARTENVKFTFDDIYVYMKKNFYFYNCINLYETYISRSINDID